MFRRNVLLRNRHFKRNPGSDRRQFSSAAVWIHSRPGDMRGDEQPALLCDSEQRAVFRHRFFAEDIQPGSQDFMIVQGIGEICFADDRSSSHVQKDRFGLHFAERFRVHQTLRIFVQRRVDGQDI